MTELIAGDRFDAVLFDNQLVQDYLASGGVDRVGVKTAVASASKNCETSRDRGSVRCPAATI